MKLSIIIPTKDRGHVFNLTISNAIKAIHDIDAEIIVVNDSKTATVEIPESSMVHLLTNPKSGVAAARNFGAAHSRGEVLLFMDDDILVSNANIKYILRAHLQFPDAALNLPRNYPTNLLNHASTTSLGRFLIRYGFTSMKGELGNEWKDEEFIELTVAASFFLCMHRNVFEKIGRYNELFPHAGSEDYDFSMRMKEMEIKRLMYTKSNVFHNEADRIELKNWLARKQRGAETRAWGYILGRSEEVLYIPFTKKTAYSLLSRMKSLLIAIQINLPHAERFDILNHAIIHALLGTSIYEGYKKGLKDAREWLQ